MSLYRSVMMLTHITSYFTQNLLIVFGLAILSHILIQAVSATPEADKKVKEAATVTSTLTATTKELSSIKPLINRNDTAPANSDKKPSDISKKEKTSKRDLTSKIPEPDSSSLKYQAATRKATLDSASWRSSSDEKVNLQSSPPKDLTTASGHHKKKYILVKKKPKHKKIKMEVYKPKMKYKKIKMKVPVKMMKKKKVKGYLVKKHHHYR